MSEAGPDDALRSQAERWDARYRVMPSAPEPALILREWSHLIAKTGRALDLACGLGGNALWLAQRGLRVSAWDLSNTAIARLREAARQRGLAVDTEVRDLIARPPPAASFDLICVVHFLERSLATPIAAALRPGGLLLYQTFTTEGPSGRGPRNPNYRLGPNELLALFRGLRVRAYREEGALAVPETDFGGLALLAAERVT